MSELYDVIIIGGGPSFRFAAKVGTGFAVRKPKKQKNITRMEIVYV